MCGCIISVVYLNPVTETKKADGRQGGALGRGASHLEPSSWAGSVPIHQCSLADSYWLTHSLLVPRVPWREAGAPAVSGRPFRARGSSLGRMLVAGESLCSSRRCPGPFCHMPHINWEADFQSVKPMCNSLAKTSCAQGPRSCANSLRLGPKICTYSLTYPFVLQVCQVLQGPHWHRAAHTHQGVWNPL